MRYDGFPRKLSHEVPHWVEPGSLFHIRIAVDRQGARRSLTDKKMGKRLMESARLYELKQRWYIMLFLLMPDHIHALLSFGKDQVMSQVTGQWKHFHAEKLQIAWQEGFFDHRLRDDERGEQLSAKADYIRNNPVAAGLGAKADDWPWVIG